MLSCGWAAVPDKPLVIPELKQSSGDEGMFTPSRKYLLQREQNAHDVAKLFAADHHDPVRQTPTPKPGQPPAPPLTPGP